MESVTYTCSVCGHQVKVEKDQPIPMCCGKAMDPMPYCTSAPNPEMARNYDDDEPCDNGTLGKKK